MAAVVPIKKELLDDLASRFVINIPENDKKDFMKLCSHLEPAHWHYLDFIRPDNPSHPACSFKEFVATMLKHCEYLQHVDVSKLTDQWKANKHKKPVRGAILLNKDLTKCVLVQGYPASTSWGFPKGKLEQGESDIDAAVREVYEEVGLDIRGLIKEDQYIEVHTSRMYIITNVSEEWYFEPKARKEIREIQWFNIKDLPMHRNDNACRINLKMNPNKFFLVTPFLILLREKINFYKLNQPTTKLDEFISLAPSLTFLNFKFNYEKILHN